MTSILIYSIVACAAISGGGLAAGDVENADHGGGGAHFGTPPSPSGHDHFGTGHNVEFDHEAILGISYFLLNYCICFALLYVLSCIFLHVFILCMMIINWLERFY